MFQRVFKEPKSEFCGIAKKQIWDNICLLNPKVIVSMSEIKAN